VIAIAGGATGLAFAFGGVSLFRALGWNLSRIDLGSSPVFPRLADVSVNPSILVFAFALSILTGLAFGMVPAFRHTRRNRIDIGRASCRAQAVLVAGEIALATILCVCGALLLHSFVKLATVDAGYDAENVLTFQVVLPSARYADAHGQKTFAEQLVARLGKVPGVHAAACANQLPMVALRDTAGGLWKTADVAARSVADGADARLVSRAYLETMGIRLVAGRSFDSGDREGRPRVLLINEALARRDFAGENPIGQTAYIGRDPMPWQIVGIVADVRQAGLDREPEPQFFIDVRQWNGSPPLFPVGAYYAVRTRGTPTELVPALRVILRELDPETTLDNVATMEQIVSNSITRPRLYAVLSGIFAVCAIALAAVGIFGVMAYSVTERTREIGIRMALGARAADVLGLVLGQSLAVATLGIVIGIAGAAGLSRWLEGLLFGLAPLDPATFVVVSVGFAAVAAMASYVPARRATHINPVAALRHD
jgi:putative ABC transport system permease protein